LAYQAPAAVLFSTNQPPAISQQYFPLRTNQHQPSGTSQTIDNIVPLEKLW
jgi:hypothetical protein